eukprot:365543-Chlamydomonas_euryale.AAC.4
MPDLWTFKVDTILPLLIGEGSICALFRHTGGVLSPVHPSRQACVRLSFGCTQASNSPPEACTGAG